MSRGQEGRGQEGRDQLSRGQVSRGTEKRGKLEEVRGLDTGRPLAPKRAGFYEGTCGRPGGVDTGPEQVVLRCGAAPGSWGLDPPEGPGSW